MPLKRIQAAIGTERLTAMTSTDRAGAVLGRSGYPSHTAVWKNSRLSRNPLPHMTTHISATCAKKRPTGLTATATGPSRSDTRSAALVCSGTRIAVSPFSGPGDLRRAPRSFREEDPGTAGAQVRFSLPPDSVRHPGRDRVFRVL